MTSPAAARPGADATTRLVCVGDSFTEGMADVLRTDGHHTGWADRVALALARQAAPGGGRVAYANLAVRGKLLEQVVTDQLPAAAALEPDLLTFHAGPNDVLRSGRLADLLRRYDEAVAQAAGCSGTLVLFTSIGRTGGSGRVAEALAARFAAFNAQVRTSGARHGALVVDVEGLPALADRRVWDVDRLHLDPQGHARVAAALLEVLGVREPDLLGGPPGWWRVPLPPGPRAPRRAEVAADVRWLRRYLAPWVGRRLRGTSSGDGRAAKDDALHLVDPV